MAELQGKRGMFMTKTYESHLTHGGTGNQWLTSDMSVSCFTLTLFTHTHTHTDRGRMDTHCPLQVLILNVIIHTYVNIDTSIITFIHTHTHRVLQIHTFIGPRKYTRLPLQAVNNAP